MQESISPFHHQSVLLEQTVSSVLRGDGSIYLDGTLGGGGHTYNILETEPNSLVVGIDRDTEALRSSRRRLSVFGDRFIAVHGCFGNMLSLLKENDFPQHFQNKLLENTNVIIKDMSIDLYPNFDGIILDLGVNVHPNWIRLKEDFPFQKMVLLICEWMLKRVFLLVIF